MLSLRFTSVSRAAFTVSAPVLTMLVLASVGCHRGGMAGGAPPPMSGPASGPAATADAQGATTRDASSRNSTPRANEVATKARGAVPSNDDVTSTVVSVFGDTAALHPDSATAADAEPVWDIDVRSYETHERVSHYVQLFSTTAREHFTERLSRGTRYEPMIRAKMRANGMPEDLTYLALIESGYDPNAYSRAAAVGMWQFMSSTARDVGLRVDWWMDERRDPVRSTEAAIRFLGFLQKQFGSLYLAAAAYNGGPGRVSRGLTRFADELEGKDGEDRFFALAEQNYLRSETKNYVPQLIAAALIAKMPTRYGVTLDSVPPLAYDSVLVPPGTSLTAIAGASQSAAPVLRDLNPAILRGITPPDTAIWVHVPVGVSAQTAAALEALDESERTGFHVVQVANATTTLDVLARREDVTVKQLRWYNPNLKTTKKGRLIAGQSVRVPTRASVAMARELPDPSIERWGGGASSTSLRRGGLHVVKRGETIGSIANRYGLSVTRLKSLNGMRGSRLIAGQTLRVSASRSTPSTRKSTSTASKSSAKSTSKSASSSKAKSGAKGKSTAKAKSKSASKSASKSSAKSGRKGATKSSAKKPTTTKRSN